MQSPSLPFECSSHGQPRPAPQLLPTKHPGKAGGPPGDAFELVYTTVTDTVRAKMHEADPVVGEWIRCAIWGRCRGWGLAVRVCTLLTEFARA